MKQKAFLNSEGMFTNFRTTKVLQVNELNHNQFLRAFDTLKPGAIHEDEALALVEKVSKKNSNKINQFNVLKGVLVSETLFEDSKTATPAVVPYIVEKLVTDDFLIPDDRFSRLLNSIAPIQELREGTYVIDGGGVANVGVPFEDATLAVISPAIVPSAINGAAGTVTFPAGGADFTVGAGGDFATLDLALADVSVVNGTVLEVLNGTYTVSSTININKSVTIFGESKAGVIFETAGAAGDPVQMFNVSVDDVVMKDMTIKHKKTTNTSVETAIGVSGGGLPQTRVDGFILDNCRIEHVEFALTIRGSNWKIANSQFAYAGPANGTRRHLGIYGVYGSCFIYNNESEDNGATGNTRWINIISTTGTNPNETVEGSLVIEGNTQTVGSLQQFYSQDNWQGSAGGYDLYVLDNTTVETSAFISMFGTLVNFADIIGTVQVSGNSLSGLHGGAPIGCKGLIGFDGGGGIAPRSSALPVNSSGNTLGNLIFRTDYTEAVGSSGSIVGYHNVNLSAVSVTLSGTLAPVPAMPATPSTGGYAGVAVTLRFVTRALHPVYLIKRQATQPASLNLFINNNTHAVVMSKALADLLGIAIPAY